MWPFFQVHGSKLKLHPVRHLSQASVLRITHRVFFLGIREDPFNGFLSALVELRVRRRISGIVRQFLIVLPDMPLHRFDTVLGMRTPFSGRTGGADIRITLVFPISITVRRAIFQGLVTKGTKRSENRTVIRKLSFAPRSRAALSFDYGGAIFALPEAFFFDSSGAKAAVHCKQPRFPVKETGAVFSRYFMDCARKVAICALVQVELGSKRPPPTPAVMPFSTAQATACA